jgi:IclR family acetate operon transcriptional repressor
VTEKTITKPDILRQELSKIRDRGYTCTHGQRTPGAVALGAPIQAPDNKVLGSIVITMPEQRFNKKIQHEMKRPLIKYAKNISAEISGVIT